MNKYLKTSAIGGPYGPKKIQWVQKPWINISAKSKRYYTDSVRCPIGVIDYLQMKTCMFNVIDKLQDVTINHLEGRA